MLLYNLSCWEFITPTKYNSRLSRRFFLVSLYPLFCNWAVWLITDKDTGKSLFVFLQKEIYKMSENKKYFYLKLKDSFFSSEEMLVLESVPDGMIYQNIYLRMCLLSLKNEGALTFKNMLPYDLKMLATVLRVDIAQMKMALELFEQLGLVTKTDNEVLFMSDIQALIGQSSTEAERIAKYRKRIAGCTESVQMLQTCTPKIELKTELKTETEKEQEEIPPAYIQEKIPIIKAEIQPFLADCFNKINLHNAKKKNIIPIEKDLSYFQTGKGRAFVELAKQYDISELKSAFENYLFVAESDTWKNSFSLNAFCKNVVEYIPSNFDMTRYIDMPKGGLNQLLNERMDSDFDNGCTYRIATLVFHKKEWFNMGMPKGRELEALVKHWLSEDEKNGVDYSALNDDYYEYIKGAKND